MLFSFGYFPFYEYAVICRNYAIGMLLLCSFRTLFKSWRRKFPIIGLVLLLLAHTSVHALIIVISIVVLLLAEVLLTPDRPKISKIGIIKKEKNILFRYKSKKFKLSAKKMGYIHNL